MALFPGSAGCCWRPRTRRPGSVLDQAFVDAHCAGFDEYRPRTGESTGTRCWRPPGCDGTRSTASPRCCSASERTIVCWAMGLDPAPHAVATIGEVANLLLLRGMIGKPGAGVVPGARALQRPGRPDDGHLGEDARGVPGRALDASSASPPAQARLRHRRRDPRHARRAGARSSSAWAATSPRPRPTPRSPRRRCAAAR